MFSSLLTSFYCTVSYSSCQLSSWSYLRDRCMIHVGVPSIFRLLEFSVPMVSCISCRTFFSSERRLSICGIASPPCPSRSLSWVCQSKLWGVCRMRIPFLPRHRLHRSNTPRRDVVPVRLRELGGRHHNGDVCLIPAKEIMARPCQSHMTCGWHGRTFIRSSENDRMRFRIDDPRLDPTYRLVMGGGIAIKQDIRARGEHARSNTRWFLHRNYSAERPFCIMSDVGVDYLLLDYLRRYPWNIGHFSPHRLESTEILRHVWN